MLPLKKHKLRNLQGKKCEQKRETYLKESSQICKKALLVKGFIGGVGRAELHGVGEILCDSGREIGATAPTI